MKFVDPYKYFEGKSRLEYVRGFKGEENSPEHALHLAHRMALSHYRGTDVHELASMAAQMAERLIDFEADFKKTVADTCAPDEKHCSCVPHLRRALDELAKKSDSEVDNENG